MKRYLYSAIILLESKIYRNSHAGRQVQMYNKMIRNKKLTYFNILRGFVRSDQYIEALVIIKSIRNKAKEFSSMPDANHLFQLMKDVSYELGIRSPFEDMRILDTVYRSLDNIDELTWKEIIASYNSEQKSVVPESIVEEMFKKFTSEKRNVLVAEAEKFSSSLLKMIAYNQNAKFTFITDDVSYYKLLKLAFEEDLNISIEKKNIYQYGFTNDKYDFIFSVPTFGVREKAREDSQFISRDFDMIALENLSLHLDVGGVLSIVLPARITFATGGVEEVRNFIQSMYSLVEVAELPAGIFKNKGIRTCLVTVATGRTDEVIIRQLKLDNGRLEEIQDTFVLDSELTEMGDWNIDRIFQSQDEEWVKFIESGIRKEELGSLTTIFRGKAVGKKDPTGNIGVINISNIGEYEIDYSELDYIEEEERKVSNYLLNSGDLLIPARGTAIRIAIFEEQSFPVIASSNVIVIRANDGRLSTTFLKLFLDSPLGRKMLLARQQGTTVMNISYKELNDIEIPLPTIEEQEEIANEYKYELDIYKDTIYKAEKRWNDTLDKLRNKI